MNRISALDNPLATDIPLNKPNQTKPNQTKPYVLKIFLQVSFTL